MNLTPRFLSSPLAIGYFNAFQVNAERGALDVPRILELEDPVFYHPSVSRERFDEHQAAEVAEEIGSIFRHVRDRFLRTAKDGFEPRLEKAAGSWTIRNPIEDLISVENSGGRSIHIRSDERELNLRVGFTSKADDREAHLSVNIRGTRGHPRVTSSYSLGFGEKTYESLLRYLRLERSPVCLEYMSRQQLWEGIRRRLDESGIETQGYDGDQHGLHWNMFHPDGETSRGRLWTDDVYPSLEFYFPWVPTPLFPSFLPLWEETVSKIRASYSNRPGLKSTTARNRAPEMTITGP